MAPQFAKNNDTIVVSALNARSNFGKTPSPHRCRAQVFSHREARHACGCIAEYS